jgi:GAF domain-containing protein
VARDIASAPSLDELLERASALIMERFKFDHTAIFLLDDKKEYAVLRASPTEAGGQLLANNHRLRVGEQGIVGKVAATGQAHIALDTGADAVYFNNPFLPNTRSEMALPLKTVTEVLGILDIQSNQPQAFRQEDIEIMQIMADQLAIGIERIRLLQQVETQLQEIERAYQSMTRQSWVSFVSDKSRNAGYKFKGAQLQPIRTVTEPAVTNPAGKEPEDKKETKIPVQLRGQTIGFVDVRFQNESTHAEIVTIIEQIAERLALAMENARLLEDAQHRASKEQKISDITSKIGQSINLRNVLQTAVEQLGRAIPGSDVIIQFQSDSQTTDQEK